MSANHNEKSSSILAITCNLAITAFFSGLVIAAVYFVTNPVAKVKAEEMRVASMKELAPQAEKFEDIEEKSGWVAAIAKGSVIAYIVPAETKGYGGVMKLLVAIDKDGKILDYTILSHNETPGLGDNAEKEPFKSQFRGKTKEFIEIVKNPSDTEHIQAMTGATISSRAVARAVKQAAEDVLFFRGK
ncbi:MAG: RnfABCDGE type electron transport complex subunit G [Selenomonadaceae bacterium]|nr:RnfABCDGE type electron transport complex subunit G [Selenomonadaceae bacterium]